MAKIIGMRFRQAGKIYYYKTLETDVKKGGQVIVETARGVEMGRIVLVKDATDQEAAGYRGILRLATKEDLEKEEANRQKEKEAFKICKEKIAARGLGMKLVKAEYTFDCGKLLFYFTAEGRVDFRELVKDLAWQFRTRIELRQIGVRDEAKILGGIGMCGRALCCHSYLPDFVPVSIKMAKEQNLSLNPQKISGVCGRLMCCLKNEAETYEYLNSHLPSVGDMVTTKDGLKGRVHSISVLRQKVKVIVSEDGDEKEIKEYPAEELKFSRQKKKWEKEYAKGQDKEIRMLEEMEKKEKKSKLDDD